MAEHATLPLAWLVTEALDGSAPGRPQETRWAGCHQAVAAEGSGPLPGRPAERGEFVMKVQAHGHRPGWWITTTTWPAACR